MLTIAQRRSISQQAMTDPEFRALLTRDPEAAVHQALGPDARLDGPVDLLVESPTRWAFVLPANIADSDHLPEPTDPRSAVENDVYAALRDAPESIDMAVKDPRAFLSEKFGIDVNDVDLRREAEGRTIIVVPHQDSREELSDELLDLVAGADGGGNQPTATIESTGSIHNLDNLGDNYGQPYTGTGAGHGK